VKIAYLVKRFPRLSETFVLGEYLEVRRQGVDTVLYALMDPDETIIQPAARALVSEVTYLHDVGQRTWSWARLLRGAAAQAVAHPLRALRVVWAIVSVHRSRPGVRHGVEGLWLARDLRRRGIDHIHAHFAHSPAAVAYMAHLAGGLPFSFTTHAKDLYTTLPRNLRIRIRAASFVVTCTEANADHIHRTLETASTPVHVVHHGVDLTRFTPRGRCPVPGRLISVGRVVEKKGFDDVLSAVALLRAKGFQVRWEVYGSGPLRDGLRARATSLGVADSVILHGARVQDEILAAYRSAAAFVLAPVVLDNGDRDGIPNVLVEAMACGVPVVATRVSGIPELVEEGTNGLLVQPRQPDQLAAALARVLGDPEFAAALGDAGRRTVEQRFDRGRTTTRLVELFNGKVRNSRALSGAEHSPASLGHASDVAG